MWWWILGACAISFATKYIGFLLPEHWLEKPAVIAVTNRMTIGLLAALIASNALSSGCAIAIDARLAAFAVAIVLLSFDVPFLAVVISGALSSAVVRAFVPEYYEPQVSLAVAVFACGVIIFQFTRRSSFAAHE